MDLRTFVIDAFRASGRGPLTCNLGTLGWYVPIGFRFRRGDSFTPQQPFLAAERHSFEDATNSRECPPEKPGSDGPISVEIEFLPDTEGRWEKIFELLEERN